MTNFTLYFPEFTEEHYGKDPFLVPYYLSRELQCNSVHIIYDSTRGHSLPKEREGVNLIDLPHAKGKWYISCRAMYVYLWKHAKEIDYFMLFFDCPESRMLGIIYKLFNPKGKCYIKMDVNPYAISDSIKHHNWLKRWLYVCFNRLSKSTIDVVSCESKLALQKLHSSRNSWNQWGDKLVYMPNGFDEALCQQLSIRDKNVAEKENLMITVGRLGTPQKNTTMLLRALAKTNLRDWKVVLIGPIQDDFKKNIHKFYSENPDKKNQVTFAGPIYNKKELWEWYNRSKVFLLSSKYEGFALVFVESQRFHNFIISTPVGAARDVVEDGKYGRLVPIDDADAMSREIQDVVDDKTNIDVYEHFDTSYLSWESRVKAVSNLLLRH